MNKMRRVSPVVFSADPLKTREQDNWTVVLEYRGEGDGPHLVDLSHRTRLDLQCSGVAEKAPLGIRVPRTPGESVLENGILVNRMNGIQASVYDLAGGDLVVPSESEYTDVTENTLFVALLGRQVFSICEKLSALDFQDPAKQVPFLFQGPFAHIPCQIVTLSRDDENPGVVLTCSRGYGRDMIRAILLAGGEFGLKPAGEDRFTQWVDAL